VNPRHVMLVSFAVLVAGLMVVPVTAMTSPAAASTNESTGTGAPSSAGPAATPGTPSISVSGSSVTVGPSSTATTSTGAAAAPAPITALAPPNAAASGSSPRPNSQSSGGASDPSISPQPAIDSHATTSCHVSAGVCTTATITLPVNQPNELIFLFLANGMANSSKSAAGFGTSNVSDAYSSGSHFSWFLRGTPATPQSPTYVAVYEIYALTSSDGSFLPGGTDTITVTYPLTGPNTVGNATITAFDATNVNQKYPFDPGAFEYRANGAAPSQFNFGNTATATATFNTYSQNDLVIADIAVGIGTFTFSPESGFTSLAITTGYVHSGSATGYATLVESGPGTSSGSQTVTASITQT